MTSFVDFFQTVILHSWSRVTNWRLREIELTHKEGIILNANHVVHELMRKYMAWRRSLLITSIPSLFLTCVFSYINILQDLNLEPYNVLGDLTLLTPILAPTVSFLSLCLGLWWWGNYSWSARTISIGWILSLLIPIWPGLIPIDFLLQPEYFAEDPFRFQLAIYYVTLILPLIITIPSGVVRGALRIRCLLPESSLAGWFLVLASPMIPLLVFASVVLLSQLFGDGVLIAGTSLLVLSPSLYIFRRRLYTDELDEHQEIHLAYTQRAVTLFSLIGIVLVGVWALEQGFFPSATQAAQFFLEFIGRSLTTTLVCADAIFRVTIHQLKMDRERRLRDQYVEVDAFLQSILENDSMSGKLPGWKVDADSSILKDDTQKEEDNDEEKYDSELPFQSKQVEDEEMPSMIQRSRWEPRAPSAPYHHPDDHSIKENWEPRPPSSPYHHPDDPSIGENSFDEAQPPRSHGSRKEVLNSYLAPREGSSRGVDDGLDVRMPVQHHSSIRRGDDSDSDEV